MSLTPDIPYREMEESVDLSRIQHGENDELVRHKLDAVYRVGRIPVLAVGDGALGFWAALAIVPVAMFAFGVARMIAPEVGRLPNENDEEGTVAVLTHWLWTDWFGRDPNVAGQTIAVSGEVSALIDTCNQHEGRADEVKGNLKQTGETVKDAFRGRRRRRRS